jgi:hypothetical protein
VRLGWDPSFQRQFDCTQNGAFVVV